MRRPDEENLRLWVLEAERRLEDLRVGKAKEAPAERRSFEGRERLYYAESNRQVGQIGRAAGWGYIGSYESQTSTTLSDNSHPSPFTFRPYAASTTKHFRYLVSGMAKRTGWSSDWPRTWSKRSFLPLACPAEIRASRKSSSLMW